MTPSVRTLKGSKTKGFRGAPLLCPRGSNARGFSNNNFETSNDSSIIEKINSKIYEIAGLDNEQVEYIESQIKNNGVQSGDTL